MAGLTVVAAALRFWRLDAIPPGLHGDEALAGLEALRILEEGWIGPYSGATLGWTAGHLYWTALVHGFLPGEPTVWSLRFAMSLWGVASVPLTWWAVRQMLGAGAGLAAAALATVWIWPLHFSRTAFDVIPWLTFELAALGLLFAAMRSRPWLFVPLGAVTGLGVYFYILIPWSWLLIAAFTAGWFLLEPARRAGRRLAVIAGILTALVVAMPMLLFVVGETDRFLPKYRRDFHRSVLGAGEDPAGASVARYVDAVFLSGGVDAVDGAGTTALVDPVSTMLCVIGVALAWRRRREPGAACLLFLLLTVPLPAALSPEGRYRGSLGVVPVLLALAALPLSALAAVAAGRARDVLSGRIAGALEGRAGRTAAAATLGCAATAIAVWNLHAYFAVFAASPHARWAYAADFRDAVELARRQPGQPRIYFLSERWSWRYEPRKILAPDLPGEDRSREFGRHDLGHDDGDAVFVLLGRYREDLDALRRLHPGGRVVPAAASGDGPVAYSVRGSSRTPSPPSEAPAR